MKRLIGTLFTISVLLITISSILPMLPKGYQSTYFYWFIYVVSTFIIIKSIELSKLYIKYEGNNLIFVKLLLIWFLISIVRGCFVASNYWEWKNLFNISFVFVLPLITFLAIDPTFVSFVTYKWLRIALPLFFLAFPFLQGDGAGRYLIPISIILLFFPLLSKKWKIILLGFSLFVFLGDLDARSNLIKFIVPLLMSLGIYVGLYRRKKLIMLLYYIMLLLPVMLFLLGILGVFNIFEMEKYMDATSKVIVQNGKEINMIADTRTPLYKEVLISAIKHDYFIWGRTPAKGNESDLFGDQINFVTGLKNSERMSNEVCLLNIFTWTGGVGVLLYFFVFAKAAFFAVFRSKNQYARLLGLYLLFRWCYAWVEDFNNFDLSNLYLWSIVGLCYSTKFREMSSLQVNYWVQSVFDLKYAKILREKACNFEYQHNHS